ncbi:MAG: excinuclease ABC subunit C [Flavobacteriales bacterium]|nr:MAG: excinuclease ABC subunit C [Flavobacteriales bacterium]
MKTYYVYILTNKNNTVLYTGFTNDIENRIDSHKTKIVAKSFTARYNCDKLVYFEVYESLSDASHREKQIKKYRREWKENLINENNLDWNDLAEDWFD